MEQKLHFEGSNVIVTHPVIGLVYKQPGNLLK